MKRRSEVLAGPPPRQTSSLQTSMGRRWQGTKPPVISQTLMRVLLPQLCLQTYPCPGSFWQPWAPSLRLGGRSLCPLAEPPLSAATLQGPHTGPSGDGFIPALSLADDGEDSPKGPHCGLVIGVWCLPLDGIQGRDATTPGQGPASDGSPMAWDDRPGCDHVSSSFFILYILREISRLACFFPVLFIPHSHSLEASFFSSAKITA